MNLCARSLYIRTNFFAPFRQFAVSVPEVEQNEQVLIDDTDDVQAKEVEIEKKRNKSRLSSAHYNLVNGKRPYETPKSLAHLTVKYHRKMYGKYGIASGVNPSLCWPTKQETQERKEYEAVAFPYTIRKMMDIAATKRKEEQDKIEQRDKDVAAKFQKLEQWKKELNAKIAKKTAEVQAAKFKKSVWWKRSGGTLVSLSTQEMNASKRCWPKREKEQKKLEKQAKMEAKEKLLIAKLQQKNVQLNEKA